MHQRTNPFTGKPTTVVDLGALADWTGLAPALLLDAISCAGDELEG